MSWRQRIFGPGLISNVGANGISLLMQVFIQLVSVPVLVHAWGLDIYGVWLILLIIPTYLACGDLGLLGAGGNEMTSLVAQDRRREALVIFQTLSLGVIALVAVLGIGGGLLLAGPLADLIGFADGATAGHAFAITMLMLAYGLVTVTNGLANIALRATGAYSKYTHFVALLVVVENGAVLAIATAGGGLVQAAACYLAARIAGSLLLWSILRHHAGWLLSRHWHPDLRLLRRLVRPAVAMAILPIAFSLSIQSIAPVIAAAGTVAMVPLYTAVRTLTRFAVQFTAVVSTGLMPNFTVADARGDTELKSNLAALTILTSLVTLVPAALVLLLAGPWFMHVWTGGAIVPPYALIVLLTGAMLANGTWMPLSNLIIALNRHESFSYVFLACAIVMLGAAYLLVGALGIVGAGLASLALELGMLGWITVQVRRQHLLAGTSLRDAPGRALAMVRARLGRAG